MARCRLNRQNPMFLSRNPPRFGDQPAAKTKIPTFLQLFCDCGLFSISKKRNRTAVQQITWVFASQSAIGNLQTIPNRKKVALRADFLFWGLRGVFQDRSEAVQKGRRCEQGRSAQPQRRSRGGPAHRRYKMASGCPARRSTATLQEKSEGIQSRMSSLYFQTILRLL